MKSKLIVSVVGIGLMIMSAVLNGGCGASNSSTKTYYYFPAWTLDGRIVCSKNIQTVSGGSGPTPGTDISSDYYLAIMDENGSNEANIKRIGNSAKIAASPLGNYYAYAETDSNTIHIVTTTGSAVFDIDGGSKVDSLDWSPDETKLVYGVKTSATSEIYTIMRDGTAKKLLSVGEKVAWRYGNIIYFEHIRDEIYYYLASINSDGSDLRDYGNKSVYSPQVLSSNNDVIYGEMGTAYGTLDVSSSPETNTTLFDPFDGYLPKLSKNGDKITYTKYSSVGIYVVTTAGTGEGKIR